MKTRNKTNRDVIIIALFLSLGIATVAYYSSVPQGGGTSAPAAAGDTVAATAGWVSYASPKYGFSFNHPGDWQTEENSDGGGLPYVFVESPAQGPHTYTLKIWIVPQKDPVAAQAYVKRLLADDTAIDAEHAKKGFSVPPVTPIFTDQFALTAGQYPAYELFNVFEFGHNAEQIYVANGNEILAFDFPVGTANPAVADPAGNNTVAHEIIKTLQLYHY